MSTKISPPTRPVKPVSDRSTKADRRLRRLVAVLLILTTALTIGYTASRSTWLQSWSTNRKYYLHHASLSRFAVQGYDLS